MEDLKEKGHLESQVRGAFWHFECSLAKLHQFAGAVLRLDQPVVENFFWEGEKKAQPRWLCVAPSVESFCAPLRKPSLMKLWGLHHLTLWETSH